MFLRIFLAAQTVSYTEARFYLTPEHAMACTHHHHHHLQPIKAAPSRLHHV
jgi:hypothetical protein